MPAATPQAVRAQIANGRLDPIYLIVGDDDTEMSRLANDITATVEDELRAFNVDRLYATDKNVTPAAIAESARMLPMMADRRVVLVLRAEKLLKPKRRKADGEAEEGEAEETPSKHDALAAYVQAPDPQTTLVFVAADIDRSRRLSKALLRTATIVECWGLKGSRDAKIDLRDTARRAEQLVRQAFAEAGQQIEPAAARLVAERAGADIARLRGDVERLLLFAAGKTKIALADALEVVSAETAQDDWAVTSAIQRGDTAEALRQLALALDAGGVPYMILGQLGWFVREKLALDAGGVPYMILGQLGWFVREKLAFSDPRRVPRAVEALFRTDLDLKSSGGEPRVLLERLVVELCGR